MKKLFIAFFVLMTLVGCQKEGKTTYTINVNTGYQQAAQTQGVSYEADVMINEYGDGKKLTTQNLDNINEGQDYVIVPNPKTEYLTVKYSVRVDEESASFWIGEIYDIVKGENVDVNIVYTTITVKTEPKK